jgi:hypothetical protein
MMRVLLSAVVAMPAALKVAEPADEPGGLPKRLARVSRVPDLHGTIVADFPVAFGPYTEAELVKQFPEHDLALISTMAHAETFEDALESLQPTLESSIDAMAFQMQAALHVVACDLIDVSEPLNEGEQRDTRTDASPEASIAPKFKGLPPNFRWQDFPVMIPDLRNGRYPSDARTRMALWWYVKAMDVPYAVDKFVCYWTALEILWLSSDVQVTAPYQADCGHNISTCPECGKSIERQVRGASLRRYIVELGGLDENDARDLWKLRQVVHGADVFTSSRMEILGRLVPTLRAVVLSLLKAVLGDPLGQPPAMVALDGPILGHTMALLGHRIVDKDEITIVRFLERLSEVPSDSGRSAKS